MPNHCDNRFHVKGPANDITAFIARAENEQDEFALDSFVPMPEEIRNTSSPNRDPKSVTELMIKYQVSDWYDWAVMYWGTKWGAYEVTRIMESDEHVLYIFQTAWCPWLDEVTLEISKQFPTLEFILNYDEPGMGFRGTCQAKEGKITVSNSQEY